MAGPPRSAGAPRPPGRRARGYPPRLALNALMAMAAFFLERRIRRALRAGRRAPSSGPAAAP